MSLSASLLLDFTVAGKKISLSAKYDYENNQQKSYEFFGGTRDLNISINTLLDDLLKKLTGANQENLLPEDFLPDLELKDIYISYKTGSSEINLIAVTEIAGRAVEFLFYYRATKKRYAFGVRTDIESLKDLPLVGDSMKEVKLDGLGFTYASFDSNMENDHIFKLPKLSKDSERLFIDFAEPVTLNNGFNFSGEVDLPLIDLPISLAMPVEQKTLPPGSDAQPEEDTTTADKPRVSLQPKTKWFKANKKVGPVDIKQLGLRYKDGFLLLLINGNATISALKIDLLGLGIGFKITQLFKADFSPKFYLDGIGISYNAPPIEISGSFIRTEQEINGERVNVYNGGAIIQLKRFTISAIGSYANIKGRNSLFIYGVFNGPIGGPAFFFVTGIAAGFGYNRRVNIPTVDEVAQFPLVALAMGTKKDEGLSEVIASLNTPMQNGKKPIEISLGDYWLAVGIKFTSFKIIESFVLLTVNFGTRLEFAILGLSKLSWPEQSIAKQPIVHIELAILANFGPDSNVISVEGIITPNSYVLSKDCKIAGGFAFYTWVKGPHEGDFVITLGGYHPKFEKPAHYPTVPRLSLNWKISDLLSIKGELYYALTSSAIMAGGKWEVLFKTSVIKASFTLWADMLIFWAPFQYRIDVGISVRIEARIKIAFVRIHFDFSMGAQLHIWGPPFAGEVYVDWSIFSFTIPFGNHKKKTPNYLSLNEFSKGFVPQLENATGADPLNITIQDGLIGEKGEHKLPVINPQQLAIAVESFIPIKRLELNNEEIASDTRMESARGKSTYADRQQEIGIQPCGLPADKTKMEMKVKLLLGTESMSATIVGIGKGIPEALWGAQASTKTNKKPGSSKVISNALSGLVLMPPALPQVAKIRTFDFSKLFDRSRVQFKWIFTQVDIGEAYHADEVFCYYDNETKEKVEGILEKTYENTIKKREDIFRLFKTNIDDNITEIDEVDINEKIIKEGHDYFRAAPIVCEIGKLPQYSTDVK